MMVAATSNRVARATLFYAALTFGALVMLFPLLWMIATALKPDAEVFNSAWLPSRLAWENFVRPFQEKPFARWFANSLGVAAAITAGNLAVASLAGYGFAKFQFPLRRVLFLIILATYMIPLQVTMVPLFLVVKRLGWVDSYLGLIVPIMVDAFGIFLIRQFMEDLPDDYLDQARIDGASEPRIFWSVVLPMAWPILATLSILTFLTTMDELLCPLIIVTSEELRTIPLGLATFENTYQTVYNQLMAVSLLAMLPVYLVFLAFQRRVVEGITMTGLK